MRCCTEKKEVPQKVQTMDNKPNSTKEILSWLSTPRWNHSSPQSVCSRMITCDHDTSFHHPKNSFTPFINFKIEVVNNCMKKRILDDSDPEDGSEAPVKKPYSPRVCSPDDGCFVDNSSLIARQHEDSGSSTNPRGEEETVPPSLKCDEALLNLSTFDSDVDDICSLNTDTAVRVLDNVETCKSQSSSTFPNKPVLIPTAAHGHEVERGAVEEDKGYFSMSYINDHKTGTTPPQSAHTELPVVNSSLLLRTDEVELPVDERHPETSSEPRCHEQSAMTGVCLSFISDGLCPAVCEPQLEPVNSPLECHEGDGEESWNIGPPMFESSVCHSTTVKVNASSGQNTLGGGDSTVDTSFESTLPLKVQVKSKVVFPKQPTSTPPEAFSGQSLKPASGVRSLRHVTFRLEEWEFQKRRYVHLVTQHIKSNSSTNNGVVSELMSLMSDVANQTSGCDRRLQHPSDLTRRNFQLRFGKERPTMDLKEWQAKNNTALKRFSKMAKMFERSQCD